MNWQLLGMEGISIIVSKLEICNWFIAFLYDKNHQDWISHVYKEAWIWQTLFMANLVIFTLFHTCLSFSLSLFFFFFVKNTNSVQKWVIWIVMSFGEGKSLHNPGVEIYLVYTNCENFFPQVINDLERVTISYEWDMKEYLLGRIMTNALFILKMKKQVKTAFFFPHNYVSSCLEKMISAAAADLCIWENRQKTVPPHPTWSSCPFMTRTCECELIWKQDLYRYNHIQRKSCLMMTKFRLVVTVLERNGDTQGECHVMDEAETGVIQPQDKELQVFLATR